MMLAHVLGLPVEEGVLQLAATGAATATTVVVAGRRLLDRLRNRWWTRSST